jgi:hypothetical protein
MTSPRFARRALTVVCLMSSAPAVLQAQRPTPCTLVPQLTTRLTLDSLPGFGQVVFLGGGVLFKCPSRSITMRGDSAERYADHDQLVGNAVYDEPRFHVTSDFLTYLPADEKVVAAGNVHATLPSGSTLVGPVAEYQRPVPKLRPHERMIANSRPTISIVQKDSLGRPTPPTGVVANFVYMDGDSLIYASGQVVITRPEISATADSAFIDQGHETMRLMRTPRLKGTKDRPFTLTGDVIDLFSRNRKLQRVLANANAVAVSDSMTLKSDTIDLRIRNDLLDHAYAWGAKSRARAVSPSQNLLADSLDVAMPSQRVQLVRALRNALAEGKPDTIRFRAEKPDTLDWLEGDTIVAHFDTVPVKDTSKTPNVKQLLATGHASSLYHLAPSDTAERRPAINHVTARVITIDFDQQKVATVTTVDSVVGVYIEPKADTTSRRTNATTTPNKAPAKPATPSVVPLPPKKP